MDFKMVNEKKEREREKRRRKLKIFQNASPFLRHPLLLLLLLLRITIIES